MDVQGVDALHPSQEQFSSTQNDIEVELHQQRRKAECERGRRQRQYFLNSVWAEIWDTVLAGIACKKTKADR